MSERIFTMSRDEPKAEFLNDNRESASGLDTMGGHVKSASAWLGQQKKNRRRRKNEKYRVDVDVLCDETFAYEAIDKARDHEEFNEDTALRHINLHMEHLRQILSMPIKDHPTWGPIVHDDRKHKPDTDESRRGLIGATVGKVDLSGSTKPTERKEFKADHTFGAQDKIIDVNLEQSRRYSSYAALYFLAAIACIAIVIGALLVDYEILSEFWTRTIANEYMKLPEHLSNSILFKSMQVLVATIALHMLIRRFGKIGLTVFSTFLFVITTVMLLGLGYLLADSSLPSASQAMIDGTQDRGSLSSMIAGMKTDGAAFEEGGEGTLPFAQEFQNARIFLWFVTLTTLFFVVASVGALFIRLAEENIRNFNIARSYNHRRTETGKLRQLEAMNIHLTSDT